MLLFSVINDAKSQYCGKMRYDWPLLWHLMTHSNLFSASFIHSGSTSRPFHSPDIPLSGWSDWGWIWVEHCYDHPCRAKLSPWSCQIFVGSRVWCWSSCQCFVIMSWHLLYICYFPHLPLLIIRPCQLSKLWLCRSFMSSMYFSCEALGRD